MVLLDHIATWILVEDKQPQRLDTGSGQEIYHLSGKETLYFSPFQHRNGPACQPINVRFRKSVSSNPGRNFLSRGSQD